ncbi:MAG: hypothetical protein M1831_001744 [Alyxoria varia]|nr:MAG: hypothetical protein M1831_001744 [Alyxoria varia]
MATAPPLGQSVGYGVVIGLGFLFAFAMILTTFILKRYNNEVQTSEMFSTAGRSVKSGLVASAVVSSWTWAATLLQSSGVAYKYGVSGAFWYASGATVQVLLFATLAIQLKRRAPNAHTFLEIIRARYGVVTHVVYIVFALMTNVLVTAMLLTGGSATVTSLTGMPTAAGTFLLPIGVVLYTLFGGIKATFLTDYAHTVVVIIILFVFAFTAYGTNEIAGSPGRIYDLLVQAGNAHPVEGNAQGSYLTFRSREGGIFFVINLVGNFGTVFLDTGYWQKAISANPTNTLPGYVMGGLSWFAIPWLSATTMGLSALALESNRVFPTYPDRMPDADVTAGLVLPNAAVALLGKGGAAATLLLIFMAVTSAMSAELVAVSSIFTYDVFKTYINPEAKGTRLITVAHTTVVLYSLVLAGFSTGLYYIGISMGYLYLLMGCIISAAVLPASLTMLWSGQSWLAATISPPLGLCCALIAWLVTAKKEGGTLSVDTTGANYPMLSGNVTALLSPIIFVPVCTYILGRPQKYNWESMYAIRKGDDSEVARKAHVNVEAVPGSTGNPMEEETKTTDQKTLERASKISKWLTVFMALALLILWPMPMYGSGYIFSKPFFTGWVTVAIIWLFCSAGCVIVYPLWESRATSSRVVKSLFKEICGKARPPIGGAVADSQHDSTASGSDTPVERLNEKAEKADK